MISCMDELNPNEYEDDVPYEPLAKWYKVRGYIDY